MNKDVLCVFYSRTGKTEEAAQAVAEGLECEVTELWDNVRREGTLGWLRCGLDAVRKRTHGIEPLDCRRPLSDYRLVILAAPVWAGRCASVMRALLKRRGHEMQDTAFLITHKSGERYPDVFRQMDQYLLRPHVAEVSLVPGSEGYTFWIGQFVTDCRAFLER